MECGRSSESSSGGYNQQVKKKEVGSKKPPGKVAASRRNAAYDGARMLREKVTPDELAAWKPRLRKKTVRQLIEATLHDRLPGLTSLRYQRMAGSAFGFFRGSAAVMAYDLSLGSSTGIEAQLCGDAHVQNLGAFEGADGRLIFDINDFDETLRGPFEWDVKRMATSIMLAGREAKIKAVGVEDATESFLGAYLELIECLLPMPVLEVARFQVHGLGGVASISKILCKAERATPLHSLESLTTAYPKGRVFKSNPPLLRRIVDEAERKAVLRSLGRYMKSLQPERDRFFARYTPVDVAFKVVGTGSVGLRDYVVYLEGNGPGDPLFLQVKQETASCFAPYRKHDRKQHQGERVVEGQRAMQIQSDPLLGWTTIGKHDYLVRQLNDHKASIEVDALKANDLCQYGMVCGRILARGHARSGDVRQIAGYLGNGKRFKRAMLQFVERYANQMTVDWRSFAKAHGGL